VVSAAWIVLANTWSLLKKNWYGDILTPPKGEKLDNGSTAMKENRNPGKKTKNKPMANPGRGNPGP